MNKSFIVSIFFFAMSFLLIQHIIPQDFDNTKSDFNSNQAATTLGLTVLLQGFYNSGENQMNEPIPLSVSLMSINPDNVAASKNIIMDNDGFRNVVFDNFTGNGDYYIVLKNWNMVETWSKNKVTFTVNGTSNYDFTTAMGKAFGDNSTKVDEDPVKYGCFIGDVNQDGVVDLTDNISVYNDAKDFENGEIVTDLNGDFEVNLEDVLICYNNTVSFIFRKRP